MKNIGINILIYVMAVSIPAIIIAAIYFKNPDLLLWITIPVIFFMAG